MKPLIAIPDDAPPVLGKSEAFQILKDIGGIRYFDSLPRDEAEVIERIAGAQVAVNIRSSCRFTRRVFEASPQLRIVSIWGTGTDNVDLEAARAHGVTVTNTPGVAAPSVAEHGLALLLAVAHRITGQDAAVRRGEWPRGDAFVLAGKTAGVIGLGAIGLRFAELARGIGMRVMAWTMHPKPETGFAHVALDELLRESDVISVHVRLSDETKGMIGAREFSLMKPGAILINTARGAIVEEAALMEALSKGRIAGAGLDVFAAEPLPAEHPFIHMPNTVLTPHSGGITPEALAAGLELAVKNVRDFLAGSPSNVVAGADESNSR